MDTIGKNRLTNFLLTSTEQMTVLILTLCLLAVSVLACNTTSNEPEIEYQTKILSVTVEPKTLSVGDTAIFRVEISDSLDTNFKFSWAGRRTDYIPLNGRYDSSVVKWNPSTLLNIQEVEIQEYSFTVIADNGDDRALAPEQRFSFFMKKN
jgi:hypothetical protein